MHRRLLVPFVVAAAVTLPSLFLKVAGIHYDAPLMALISGFAMMGASFLLLWACDAAQADISRALALAVVALIAVLPEYSVDMYFTWQAGQHPESDYASYAIANMTGANRLLIGVAWPLIVVLTWLRFRHDARMAREQNLEVLFLGVATAYALLIPIKGSLAWYDGVVLVALYGLYVFAAARRPAEEHHMEGPAQLLIRMSKPRRRAATVALFLFAAGVIIANAEVFCESLVATGKILNINEFLLVQWLAPLASESPEFVLALVFVWRGQAGVALGSLISSKLNQWTLLVGMIPAVFAISSGGIAQPIPMGSFQMGEILLTAAQSLLGIVLLLSGRLSLGGGLLLAGLFVAQFLLPQIADLLPGTEAGFDLEQSHAVLSLLYFVASLAIFIQAPRRLCRMVAEARRAARPGHG